MDDIVKLKIIATDVLFEYSADRYKVTQYNEYFKTLFKYGQTQFTVDFPSRVVCACLDLFIFAASVQPTRFICNLNGEEYEKKNDQYNLV